MARPLAAVALLLLAGCVAPSDAPVDLGSVAEAPLDWATRALPYGKGHDHEDPDHHVGLSTPNFHLLGWDPLLTDYYGRSSGGNLCGDGAEADGRRLAAVHGFQTDVALVLSDVTDPAAPKKLGELSIPYSHARDVAMTADMKYVVLGMSGARTNYGQGGRAIETPLPVGLDAAPWTWTDACGRTTAVAAPPATPSGIVLVDVQDPMEPTVVDYFPQPTSGTHSIYATEIDGTTVVVASVLNGGVQPAGYWSFFTVEDGAFVFQSAWNSVPVSTDPPLQNFHNDAWVHKHPVTGQTIAYLADWDGGLVLLDVSDLRQPKEMARWSNFVSANGEDNTGNTHSALVMDELWGDRLYAFVGQEILDHPRDTPTGVIWAMDVTDPTMPEILSAWTLPVDVEWEDPVQFSTHYPTVFDRTMFVTMYHGGLWAVDVADPASPESVGVFVPDKVSPKPQPEGAAYSWSPTVMETKVYANGDIALFDATSGVYMVRFDAARAVPAVAEWEVPT